MLRHNSKHNGSLSPRKQGYILKAALLCRHNLSNREEWGTEYLLPLLPEEEGKLTPVMYRFLPTHNLCFLKSCNPTYNHQAGRNLLVCNQHRNLRAKDKSVLLPFSCKNSHIVLTTGDILRELHIDNPILFRDLLEAFLNKHHL